MHGPMTDLKRRTFRFSRGFGKTVQIEFEQSLFLPLKCSLDECFHQLVEVHRIPPFAHSAVRDALKEFVTKENQASFDARYESMWNEVRSGARDLNRLCEQLDTAYQMHVSTYANPLRVTDEEVFSQAYNRVIHSPAALKLIQLEHTFAQAVSVEVEKRNAVLQQLQMDLLAETEKHLQKRDVDTAQTVTQLQKSHIRNRDLVESQWNSCISELRHRQRRQLRELVMSLDEQLSLPELSVTECASMPTEPQPTVDDLSAYASTVSSNSSNEPNRPIVPLLSGRLLKRRSMRLSQSNSDHSHTDSSPQPWSESFTVQLGRQMRTTCTFRLLRSDPNDLLQSISPTTMGTGSKPNSPIEPSEDILGERLSNALGIYSNDLNGLVILVDKRLNAYRGVERLLAEACERSTEFHFPELGCQLADIRQTCHRIASECSDPTMVLRRPIPSSQRGVSIDQVEPVYGDVYITRHSNLTGGVIGGMAGGGGGTGIVFHLVADNVTDREEDRIRSGSPLHCALSAILRICFDYDITTLSLPLLLVQSLQEYMDVNWRARRAETVFKALKGVLMELSTWRGPTVRSIQFLAPPQLSDAELTSFSRIITSSFLQPVPVIVPA